MVGPDAQKHEAPRDQRPGSSEIRCTNLCRACQPLRPFQVRPLTAAPTPAECGAASFSHCPPPFGPAAQRAGSCSYSHAGVSTLSPLPPPPPLSHAVATMTLKSARVWGRRLPPAQLELLTGRSANAGSADMMGGSQD